MRVAAPFDYYYFPLNHLDDTGKGKRRIARLAFIPSKANIFLLANIFLSTS